MTARQEAAAQMAAPAARTRPYLIGVRHHSPALAVAAVSLGSAHRRTGGSAGSRR
ncbi:MULTISPECIES: hypothetical protein [unclassified Streptomyces]|uniref:hypothetical protein n=1 Tax=unclassified Streptomyces TaxID=2593676 RepID=UPI003077F253